MKWIISVFTLPCIVAAITVLPAVTSLASQHIQTGCGRSQMSIHHRIMHGESALKGEWPWHVAIFHRTRLSIELVCGGTLLSRKHVLTTAHCVTNQATKSRHRRQNVIVEVGAYDLDQVELKDKQRHDVKAIITSDQYTNEDKQHDIAVLELYSEVIFSQFVQPSCVYLDEDLEGKVGTVVGWGLTEHDEASTILKKARLPVVDFISCLMSNREAFGPTLSKGMFCAGYLNGTGVCNGDSGGGFFIDIEGTWHVAGIVSYTASRAGNDALCQTNGYAVYTRIYDYLPWINKVTRLNYPLREDVSAEDLDTNYCEVRAANGTKSNRNALPIDCGVYTPNKIRNGRMAEISQFPWMAILVYDERELVRLCAGTLIGNRYILTSAFCVHEKQPTKVRLGEYDISRSVDCAAGVCFPPVRDYEVECTIQHPEFHRWTDDNDVALVRMKQKVRFEDHIRPICLPVTDYLRRTVSPYYIASGWGATQQFGNRSTVLNYAVVEATSDRKRCTEWWRSQKSLLLSDSQLCIGDKRTPNACYGDYGGPLGHPVKSNGMRFVQFGIVSMPECGFGPSVYTDVSAHMDWILANVRA